MARDHGFVFGVDIDNVLADYTAGLRRVFAEHTGADPDALPVPSLWSHYEEWGLDETTFAEWHRRAVVDERMFLDLDPLPGAAEVLRRLSEAGVRVRIVTHRLYLSGMHAIAAGDTVSWLEQHDIPYWDLCMVARKADVGCDLYVDDAPHNIANLRGEGFEAIVFDQPYNTHMAGPRAVDWSEVEDLVLERLVVEQLQLPV